MTRNAKRNPYDGSGHDADRDAATMAELLAIIVEEGCNLDRTGMTEQQAAQARQPEGHHETIWRALLSLRHAALVSDDLADIAALSAQASAAEREFLTIRR